MKKIVLIVLIATQFILADGMNNKTEIFSKYLQTNHNLQIPQEMHNYLIVNAVACKTCKKIDFEFLAKLSERRDITILISFSQRKKLPKEINELIKKRNIYLDKGNYYEWNITPLTDGLIVTEKSKIQKIHKLEYWAAKDVKKILSKK